MITRTEKCQWFGDDQFTGGLEPLGDDATAENINAQDENIPTYPLIDLINQNTGKVTRGFAATGVRSADGIRMLYVELSDLTSQQANDVLVRLKSIKNSDV